MPALAESWLPAPTQPSCACTLCDFSGGLCLWKAAFSSSPALFPPIVTLAKAGCWCELFHRCNGGFSCPASSWKQSRQRQPWAVLWWAGMSTLLRNTPSPNPCPDQQSSAGHCCHCSTLWLGTEIGEKCWKAENFHPCVKFCCHFWRLSSSS